MLLLKITSLLRQDVTLCTLILKEEEKFWINYSNPIVRSKINEFQQFLRFPLFLTQQNTLRLANSLV